MTKRMNQALMDFVHEDVHRSVAVSVAAALGDETSGAVSIDRLAGPLALGMVHQGIMFALRSPAAARAYDDMLRGGMGLDSSDLAAIAEDLGRLEAAWRPLQ
jgi:hypothetical protein